MILKFELIRYGLKNDANKKTISKQLKAPEACSFRSWLNSPTNSLLQVLGHSAVEKPTLMNFIVR